MTTPLKSKGNSSLSNYLLVLYGYIIPLFLKNYNHGQHSLPESEKYNLLHILILKCCLKQVEMSSSNCYVLIYLKVQNNSTCTYSIYEISSQTQLCTFLDALVSRMELSATEYPGPRATSGYSSLHPILFIYRHRLQRL